MRGDKQWQCTVEFYVLIRHIPNGHRSYLMGHTSYSKVDFYDPYGGVNSLSAVLSSVCNVYEHNMSVII